MRQDESMMHECPKCGFVQPKDRYCANCGLDIDSYTPAPVPLFKRLAQNIGLQMTVATILILGLGLSIYFSQKDKIEKHLRQAPQAIEEMEKMLENSDRPERLGSTAHDAVANAPNSEADIPSGDSDDARLTNPTPTKMPTSPSAIKEVHVTFIEASKSLLQHLASEGQILHETAQMRSFVHSKFESISKLKESDPNFKVLGTEQSEPIRNGAPANFDFSHLNGATNEDVGLNFDVALVNTTESAIDIDITGSLNLLAESGTTLSRQEINAKFSFSPKNSLVLVGILPRQSVHAEDLGHFASTPLTILESPQFISGVTDFAMLFEFK